MEQLPQITADQLDEVRGYINLQMDPNEDDEKFRRRLQELTDKQKNRTRFTKPKSKKKQLEEIKPGMKVINHGLYALVIDKDGELLCVETEKGEIEIWNEKDVKVIKY